MLLIFGFRVRTSFLRQVTFFCPHCQADRQGAVKRMRRWFTVFFIPIFPTKDYGEVVECSNCHRQFKSSVLDQPTIAQRGDQLGQGQRVAAVGVVHAAGNEGPARATAIALMQRTIPDYDGERLDKDLAEYSDAHLDGWLSYLADNLTVNGKEHFFNTVAAIATADGPLTTAERSMLERIAKGLLMTAAQLTGLLVVIDRSAAPDN